MCERWGGGGALPCAEHLNAMNHLLQSSTVLQNQPNAKILLSPHLKILQWWNSQLNLNCQKMGVK